jgi:hypothetical protein
MSLMTNRFDAWQKFVPQLEVADIILTRNEKSIISKSIRAATKSYWNHVVIVFSVPDKKTHFNNTLLISAEDHGIEIHRLQRYTNHFDFVDIGVKRVPGLSREMRENVVSYVLNNLDIPYDFTRLLGMVLKFFEQALFHRPGYLKRYLVRQDAFICSAFIQKAFYEVVPPEQKFNVILKNDFDAMTMLDEVTPADIARSNNCEWLYNPHE